MLSDLRLYFAGEGLAVFGDEWQTLEATILPDPLAP